LEVTIAEYFRDEEGQDGELFCLDIRKARK
jgi:F0F1-type ATP synthase beta subunit